MRNLIIALFILLALLPAAGNALADDGTQPPKVTADQLYGDTYTPEELAAIDQALWAANMTRTDMTFKNHGCCGHIFAALDAVRDLHLENGFKPEDVVSNAGGGDKATINFAGLASLKAEVARLAAKADQRTGAFDVELKLNEVVDATPSEIEERIKRRARDAVLEQRR